MKEWEISEYIIVTWGYAVELQNNVHAKINEWYQPYNGIFRWYINNISKYDPLETEAICQPMVKFKK